jgi:hypothetical protein
MGHVAIEWALAFCMLSALATWLVARGLGRVREPLQAVSMPPELPVAVFKERSCES